MLTEETNEHQKLFHSCLAKLPLPVSFALNFSFAANDVVITILYLSCLIVYAHKNDRPVQEADHPLKQCKVKKALQ